MDYTVRFKCRVIPALKPADWPDEVVHEAYYSTTDDATLKKFVDTQILIFRQQGGVTYMREARFAHAEDSATLDLRVFIPLHMVASIETSSKPVVGGMPNLDDEDLLFQ